jgi:hypothetical protein
VTFALLGRRFKPLGTQKKSPASAWTEAELHFFLGEIDL